jgi:biotin operon repressor
MLAPNPILHDSGCLLADVRMLLDLWPGLVNCPERLAALLGASERDVWAVLEALEVEGEVLP